ncbi:MAG TPA: hypothetical protein VMZ28_15865 [Kofleriaceae bacterium]|nr:hypothetical protein [Kofleriaceae bacterium]
MVRVALALVALVACDDAGDLAAGDGGSSGDAAGAADAAPDDVLPDPCAGMEPACPDPGALAEGSGLAAIDRCAFPMEDVGRWDAQDALVDALAQEVPTVTVADVLGDLDRVAQPIDPGDLPGDVPEVDSAFAWQAGDMGVRYWIPQGITSSGDSAAGGRVDGKRVLLVSWYYDLDRDPGSPGDKGVRLAIVDATDPGDVRYRLVLLVEPREVDGRASYAAVHIHAGGIAWVGDRLYVADTFHGFRVFDLSRILDVSSELDVIGYQDGVYHAHGYSYAVPQVGAYEDVSACVARFSFVALDRTTDPPSLLSGEYDATSVHGRLFRWPLAPSGRLQLFGDPPRVIASASWFSAQSHVQGALSQDDTFYLSSSKPAGAAGVLYRTAEDSPSASFGWSDSPEDLSYDPTDGLLWSLSEGLNARYVFSVPLTAF